MCASSVASHSSRNQKCPRLISTTRLDAHALLDFRQGARKVEHVRVQGVNLQDPRDARHPRKERARSRIRRPARSSRRLRQSPTFVQDAVGEHKGYDYARVANPTRFRSASRALALFRGRERRSRRAHVSKSGIGDLISDYAQAPSWFIVRANAGLIADVYGGVYRMTSQVYFSPRAICSTTCRRTSSRTSARISTTTRASPDRVARTHPEHRRYPRSRHGSARGRRDPRRRQHVCDAVSVAGFPSSAKPTS